MENKIRLKNIQLIGYHGATKKEQKQGQRFEIDIVAYTDFDSAIKTDKIDATTDYSSIYDEVVNVFSSHRFNLIESLANKIACSLTSDFSLSACKVTIRKPDAPMNGILDAVEVEVMYHA